jgi:predicted phage gp36 major capsid-like protein
MATNDEIRQSIEALEEANKLLDKNSEKYKTNKIAIDALNDSLLITVDYLEKQKKQLELQAETHKLISEQTGINIDN